MTAHLNVSAWISVVSICWVFPHPHVVYFVRINHKSYGCCGSLTVSGQVFKKILPFILVSTSAQLCKGYLANCYRRNEWHIWASRCSGLVLLMRSAKDITVCWWCSKGRHIYLICLFNTLLNFGFRQGQSILPCYLKPKRMPLECQNTRSFNLKLVSTESHFSSSNKWPKSVLSYGVKLERRGGRKWHDWIMERMWFCGAAQEAVQTEVEGC